MYGDGWIIYCINLNLNLKQQLFSISIHFQATGEGKPNLYSYPLHGVTANLAWLAPEILQQNLLGYNESSDIYSLAVTICEMANGVVPFREGFNKIK